MESLTSIFSTVSSPTNQFDDLWWFWIIIWYLIGDEIAEEKKKRRRKNQQRRLKLANQPKHPRSGGPKMF